MNHQMYGGIDLGGTRIEACLFDANLVPLKSRRIASLSPWRVSRRRYGSPRDEAL